MTSSAGGWAGSAAIEPFFLASRAPTPGSYARGSSCFSAVGGSGRCLSEKVISDRIDGHEVFNGAVGNYPDSKPSLG